MRCEEARQGLGAWHDGELCADDGQEIAAHLAECATCMEEDRSLRRLGSALVGLRHRAPDSLDRRILETISTQSAVERMIVPTSHAKEVRTHFPAALGGVRAIAATAVLAVAIGWLAATAWHLRGRDLADLSRDVVTAHVRSLITDSPVQVAHGDPHQVKPWFAGRVDFAPSVRDLREAGFTLLGGRIDIIGGRRVGVAVYKRRLHIINVFMWSDPSAPQPVIGQGRSVQGYSLLHWSRDGITFWAASDLNGRELSELPPLL